ncbi:Flp family type IVb pilin [Pseudomonas citronellolis]|uniref:Flp family type IVb pilin n=1 Tax=Pseudomonas citronellolis TaxID=53408 RepID=UPI0021C18595|nr:Flp family type IVb pilin [Pseudomonas citronellolis]MDN6871090.1 Flp family type IVb pilin [Pseudomonas citronellolis]UXJ51524.1 Flp family type IVb pilin [Pseudomonas citronellolis]
MNFKLKIQKLVSSVKAFAKDKEGATAIEYAVIAGLISVAIIATLKILGPKLVSVFQQISDAL